jgi:hypothetical protein
VGFHFEGHFGFMDHNGELVVQQKKRSQGVVMRRISGCKPQNDQFNKVQNIV